jgi:polyphosphate kinase
MFPIEDGVLRERIMREILGISLADNAKARLLKADGSYRRAALARSGQSHRSQSEFIALAQRSGAMTTKSADQESFPKVKLVPSPFAAPKG